MLMANIPGFLEFLRRLIHLFADNGRIAILNIILRFLATILFLFEGQGVRGKLLLQERIAHIPFIC